MINYTKNIYFVCCTKCKAKLWKYQRKYKNKFYIYNNSFVKYLKFSCSIRTKKYFCKSGIFTIIGTVHRSPKSTFFSFFSYLLCLVQFLGLFLLLLQKIWSISNFYLDHMIINRNLFLKRAPLLVHYINVIIYGELYIFSPKFCI